MSFRAIIPGPVLHSGGGGGEQLLTGSAGIVSAGAFGSGGVVAGPLTGSSGITSGETFGSGGTVGLAIIGSTGITSGETFGSGGIVGVTLTGTSGIPSGETFGSGGIVDQPTDLEGSSGIPSAETFGSGGAVYENILGLAGIPSDAAFGSGGVVAGPITGTAGIPSAGAMGVGGVVIYDQTLTGTSGIVSAGTFGDGSGASVSNLITGSTGIPSAGAFGSGGSVGHSFGGITGIISAEAFGRGGAVLHPPAQDTNFRVFIDQTVSDTVQSDSISVTRNLNFAGTASFNLADLAGDQVPDIGEEVAIYYWTGTEWTKFFGGSVDVTNITKPGGVVEETGNRFWAVNCVSFGKSLAKRMVTEKFSAALYGTVNSILTRLNQEFFIAEGLTLVLGDDPGVDIPDLEFNGTPLNQVMDKLGELSDLNWQVDWDRNIYLGDTPWGTPVAPFNITDTSANARDFQINRSRGLYRNVQLIKSTVTQTAPIVTKDYVLPVAQSPAVGDPYFVSFNGLSWNDTQYDGQVQELLDVKVNGVSIPFAKAPATFDPAVMCGQRTAGYLLIDWNIFSFSPEEPVDGDVITLTFSLVTTLPPQISAENPTEIAARKAIEGGTGRWENVFELQNISDPDLLLALAQNLLARFGVMGLEVNYETDEFGLECGQTQTVALPTLGVTSQTLTIESITSTEEEKTILRSKVKASNQIQQQDAMSAFNRLIKKLQNSTQIPTGQIIFSLAESIIGVTNPGLATGTDVLPPLPIVKDFTCYSVTVKFKHPPVGSSIILDLKIDGVSILSSPIEYTVTGGEQKFVQFANAPVTLHVGSNLTVDVIQVGSTSGGKDGTVNILGNVG